MVEVSKMDGTVLGYAENPVYIYLGKNGCFLDCPFEKATGIVFDGTPYHMFDRKPLKDECEDVAVNILDGGSVSYGHGISINELENALCEEDITNSKEMEKAIMKQQENDQHIADIENVLCTQDTTIDELTNK